MGTREKSLTLKFPALQDVPCQNTYHGKIMSLLRGENKREKR
jgi:hypothetical protein